MSADDSAKARDEWAAKAATLEAVGQPVIDCLVTICRLVVKTVEAVHRDFADSGEIDLGSDTRAVAIWELTGHAMALAYAVLDQVEAGHVSQLGGTERALIETQALVLAVTGGTDELVERWLSGKYVDPKRAGMGRREFWSSLADRFDRRAIPHEWHHHAVSLGLDPSAGTVDFLETANRRLYGSLSEAAHNRRGHVRRNVSTGLRLFAYRRHPDPLQRLNTAILAAFHVEITLIYVGEGLKVLLGSSKTPRPIEEVVTGVACLDKAIKVAAEVSPDFRTRPTEVKE